MFILSSSDAWQLEFTTYLGPLKNCCPKLSYKFVCQCWPKTEQPAQPTGKCCQKTNFKKTNGKRHKTFLYMPVVFQPTDIYELMLIFPNSWTPTASLYFSQTHINVAMSKQLV